jgi:hypothetical protein
MAQMTDFKIGDIICRIDYHTSVAPFGWPTNYTIVGVEKYYYIVRRSGIYTTQREEIPRYSKNIHKVGSEL